MKKYTSRFIVGSFILVVIFGTIYAVGQQILRLGANDPQIQFAEDFANVVGNGSAKAEDLGKLTKVDIAKSLQTFAIAYDKNGKILASQALLDGATPQLPQGVLDNSAPQNRVTWQPKDGVRIATVVQAHNGGYILAGRNLREVEKRESTVLQLAGLGWVLAEAGLAVFLTPKKEKATKHPKILRHARS